MRRLFIIALLLVVSSFAFDSSAQHVAKKRIGSYIENGNVVFAEAHTTLAIDLTVEVEQFTAGPYARYADRLLGCSTRRVNATKYTLLSSSVSVTDEDISMVANPVFSVVSEESDGEFSEVAIDRLNTSNIDLDKRAELAAEQIYALRTTRLELIMAEFGDGVYGAGLESALREIDRLEQEYTDLFLGKSTVKRVVYRYYIPVQPASYKEIRITPPADEAGDKKSKFNSKEPVEQVVYELLPQTLSVARFSDTQGILSSDDLSGDIIFVSIVPSVMSYPESNPKGNVVYRYANNAQVTVSHGHDTLISRVLPIYELGESVTMLSPVK